MNTKPLSEETKRKIGDHFRGKPLTEEHRKNVSLSLKGRYFSPEHRAKLSATSKGRKVSEETRQKLRIANLGKKPKPASPETRQKISLALRGKKKGPISVEARAGFRERNAGSSNPNWKGGITAKNYAFRIAVNYLPEYKKWRETVFERDEYTCQSCGSGNGKYLHAHHITSFSELVKIFSLKTQDDAKNCWELFNPANGITLCPSCHKKEHKTRAVITCLGECR